MIDQWSRLPQVSVSVVGEAHSGRKIFLIAVSEPENLEHAWGFRKKAQDAWKSLVRYPSLDHPETESPDLDALIASSKPALLIHSGSFGFEASHTEAGCQLIDHLLTSRDAEVREILQKSVVLVMPMVNPDSRELAIDQWRNYPLAPGWQGAGNSYGFLMNRDFYFLSQPENRAVHRVMDEWRPLMVLDTHEDMAFLGARRDETCWVPPFRNPRHKNLGPEITKIVDEYSAAIADRWRQEGFPVWYEPEGAFISFLALDGRCDMHFDMHGIPCLFTESARTPGGQRWEDRNRQKVLAALTFLHKAANDYARLLKAEFSYWEEQVRAGNAQSPRAFIIPKASIRVRDFQTIDHLVSILLRHGFQVYAVDRPLPAYVIPMGQPDRSLISAMLQVDPWNLFSLPPAMGVECLKLESLSREDQSALLKVPLRPITDAKSFRVRVHARSQPAPAFILANCESSVPVVNEALKLGACVRWALKPMSLNSRKLGAGSFCITDPGGAAQEFARNSGVSIEEITRLPTAKTALLKLPKIAVYMGQGANEKNLAFTGDTLWALDHLRFPYAPLSERDIQADLLAHFDVLIVAFGSAPEMLNGWNVKGQNYQPPWEAPGAVLGLREKGISKIVRFIEKGGRYIGIGSGGGALACKELGGFADVTIADQGLGQARIYLKVEDEDSPILFGYDGFRDQDGHWHAKEIPAFYYCDLLWPRMEYFSGPVFKVGPKAVTLAAFGRVDYEAWTEHMERPPVSLSCGNAAILKQRLAKGSIVLLGIALGFRGQWISNYRLLSNSIYSWQLP
jgi:hypothetical protein